MRTTISLDDEVHRQARIAAAASGRTLSRFTEEALRETLARRVTVGSDHVSLPTFRGHGLRPGVSLDNWAALLDVMEEQQKNDPESEQEHF
jgi:hypothetical protein